MSDSNDNNERSGVWMRKYIIPVAYCFEVSGGEILSDLADLYYSLREMDNEKFTHHVNEGKNDFADWVEEVFRERELANKMRQVSAKDEMVACLEDEVFVR